MASKKPVQTSDKKQTVFAELNTQLIATNKKQSDLITEIENKVHEIFNLRQPAPVGNLMPTEHGAAISDFIQIQRKELITLSSNTDRLKAIVGHLNKVV
jgi:hypothetical protein